ncbi:MAG: ornithine cyclodeaminase family protein, partial [Thermovirgaceae bacterium]|nr:ornithine cyclodeaminase family protein [Thermovirgaceae bacterium]
EDCVRAGGTEMQGAMRATERSFFLHGIGDFIQPGKPVIRWGGPETEETTGRIMSMPSFLGGSSHAEELRKRGLLGPVNTAGIKFIPSRPCNPEKLGLPRASALIIIVDPETLIPQCVMDGAIVSAMRTGAASGVAAKYLARQEAETMGLVGASVQGRTQIAAMKCGVPSLKRCKVYDIRNEAAVHFAEAMTGKVEMEIIPVRTPEEAFRKSDVISTATMAREPYVDPKWYDKGIFHAEISFWDTPPSALEVFDKIYVDDWYQVKHHGVDVSWRAVRDGFIPEEKIRGNLGDVVTGKIEGRASGNEKIFFNPIGLGIHDLSEAFRVFESAKSLGIGRNLPLWEDPSSWMDQIRI